MIAAAMLTSAASAQTTPPYGLKKAKALYTEWVKDGAKYQPKKKAYYDQKLAALSLREQFTYHMIGPEAFTQICSMIPMRENARIRIYGTLNPYDFGMEGMYEGWSARQRDFFETHRDSVLTWLQAVIENQGFVGLNAQHLIIDLKGKELIPTLLTIYDHHGDNDILTTCMMLMYEYPPFANSAVNDQLQKSQPNTFSKYIRATPENIKAIRELATQFANFVEVKAGAYWVGKEGSQRNPLRKVTINAFYIAKYETTNEEFEKFVTATGYKTDAERHHDAMVFEPPLKEFRWIQDTTAYWRYPNGKTRGGIEKKMNHPVTCISYRDIQAYCTWAHVRLPTLEEWEVACRAGTKTDFFFGDDETKIGQYANVWHGHDHMKADYSDGYMYTSPVGSFKPNPWGLYDMYGNVFEFCSGQVSPTESKSVAHARGGSWWCSANACDSYNSYAIGQVNIHASFSNQGFRVVISSPAPPGK